MSTEFGIFNDEGKIEGGMFSPEEAIRRLNEGYTEEDEVHTVLPGPPRVREGRLRGVPRRRR